MSGFSALYECRLKRRPPPIREIKNDVIFSNKFYVRWKYSRRNRATRIRRTLVVYVPVEKGIIIIIRLFADFSTVPTPRRWTSYPVFPSWSQLAPRCTAPTSVYRAKDRDAQLYVQISPRAHGQIVYTNKWLMIFASGTCDGSLKISGSFLPHSPKVVYVLISRAR